MALFRREPVGAAVSDGPWGPITLWRTARRTGAQAGLKAAPGVPVLSAMTPTMFVPARRSRISSAMFGS